MANLDLFSELPMAPTRMDGPAPCSPRTGGGVADPIGEAEQQLLDLADYIYGHTSLKPMSKTLFLVSRCLLAAPERGGDTVRQLSAAYERSVGRLGAAAPEDDFDFAATLAECASHLGRILSTVDQVRALCAGADSLGLTFNTLLRGKWESGEGLGTHLTPEEVASPMVKMALGSIESALVASDGGQCALFGDPCGGTGRFAFQFARELKARGMNAARVSAALRLYDQSSLAVDFARINFALDGLVPACSRVDDSLTSNALTEESGRYLAIATNPPFGTGKYAWSEMLEPTLGPEILQSIGLMRPGDTCDPAELFVFRCLDLLAYGGVLAVVLPDGVLSSRRFKKALHRYETIEADHGDSAARPSRATCALELLAIVSLPVATFSLGGTVAKTSFIVIRKSKAMSSASRKLPLYFARARHIGFRKRGNRRVTDPQGNDLLGIAEDYLHGTERFGERMFGWRQADRLMRSVVKGSPHSASSRPLSLVADLSKEHRSRPLDGCWFHVSVLDVDHMGTIDIVDASRNKPSTRPLACRPGDVLVSCLNPRIWRVAVIPDLDGEWTCSSEFAVLRPKGDLDPWELAIRLHHRNVIDAVVALASGTSSSRQRVNKGDLMRLVAMPCMEIDPAEVARHKRHREDFYKHRMREDAAFARLHEGDARFTA